MQYFFQSFNDFFIELASNNNKDWFDKNRKTYETEVKTPFNRFVSDLIVEVNKITAIDLEPKDAIFRINRDIRFSKDKTPYKCHVSAVISNGGRKGVQLPGMYIQFSPGECYIGGGVFKPESNSLYKIRKYIKNNSEQFMNLLSNKDFKKYYGMFAPSEKNKIVPNEFQEAAIEQPLILNKQFYFMATIEDGCNFIKEVNLLPTIMNYYKAIVPWNDFFKNALK